jgi:hypothetical protein
MSYPKYYTWQLCCSVWQGPFVLRVVVNVNYIYTNVSLVNKDLVSSVEERTTFNRVVVGSIPTSGVGCVTFYSARNDLLFSCVTFCSARDDLLFSFHPFAFIFNFHFVLDSMDKFQNTNLLLFYVLLLSTYTAYLNTFPLLYFQTKWKGPSYRLASVTWSGYSVQVSNQKYVSDTKHKYF